MPPLSATTSFICEGCCKRSPQERLYLTDAARAALEAGIFDERRWLRGQRHWIVIALVCSAACAATAPVRYSKHWREACGMVEDTPVIRHNARQAGRPWRRESREEVA